MALSFSDASAPDQHETQNFEKAAADDDHSLASEEHMRVAMAAQ
jgi:hypothetical protein